VEWNAFLNKNSKFNLLASACQSLGLGRGDADVGVHGHLEVALWVRLESHLGASRVWAGAGNIFTTFGANPTTTIYNASAVKIYKATSSLVRFKQKHFLLQ
jgi:hypothetical protein